MSQGNTTRNLEHREEEQRREMAQLRRKTTGANVFGALAPAALSRAPSKSA